MRALASATVGLVGVAAAGGAGVCPAAGDGETEDFIGSNLCGHARELGLLAKEWPGDYPAGTVGCPIGG